MPAEGKVPPERRQRVIDDLGRLMRWTQRDDPGVAVLKVHAITEDALAHAIEKLLLFEDSRYKAHDRRFSELVALATRLGLISSPEARALRALARVRNEYAHGMGATIDEERIVGAARELRDAQESEDPSSRSDFMASLVELALIARRAAWYAGQLVRHHRAAIVDVRGWDRFKPELLS